MLSSWVSSSQPCLGLLNESLMLATPDDLITIKPWVHASFKGPFRCCILWVQDKRTLNRHLLLQRACQGGKKSQLFPMQQAHRRSRGKNEQINSSRTFWSEDVTTASWKVSQTEDGLYSLRDTRSCTTCQVPPILTPTAGTTPGDILLVANFWQC